MEAAQEAKVHRIMGASRALKLQVVHVHVPRIYQPAEK